MKYDNIENGLILNDWLTIILNLESSNIRQYLASLDIKYSTKKVQFNDNLFPIPKNSRKSASTTSSKHA